MPANTEIKKDTINSCTKLTSFLLEATQQLHYNRSARNGQPRNTGKKIQPSGGGNLEFLRVFMGHTDYAVTQAYSRMAAEYKMLGADIYRLDDIFFTRGY